MLRLRRRARAHLWEPFASEKGLVAGRCAAPVSGNERRRKAKPNQYPGPLVLRSAHGQGLFVFPAVALPSCNGWRGSGIRSAPRTGGSAPHAGAERCHRSGRDVHATWATLRLTHLRQRSYNEIFGIRREVNLCTRSCEQVASNTRSHRVM